jgi:small subunit ribosomal protein S1
MSKLDEKLELYTSEALKLGIEIEESLFENVVKGLGPSVFKADAEIVSCSQESELDTVKKNFLIKKLGLEDGEELDAAIQKVCAKMGKENKQKYRAIFYYLLVLELGLESFYKEEEEAEDEEAVVAEVEEIEETEDEEVVNIKKILIEEEEAPVINPEEFLKDFDWNRYKEGIDTIDEGKYKEFEEALDGTVGFVEERQVIDGIVVRMTDREAIIDINSKSEGVISLNEFRYNPDLKVGDKVEV